MKHNFIMNKSNRTYKLAIEVKMDGFWLSIESAPYFNEFDGALLGSNWP